MVYNFADLYQMESPTFLIDGIYKSMEGPKASRYVQLNQKKVNEEELSYPDSDDEVVSPHKATRIAKRNLS